MQEKTLIVVVGPTAIGKTNLAIQLAQHFDTEIVSADSRQFFKEMNIGTAKPSNPELKAAKHHFISSHSVKTFFSPGNFEIEALQVINQIFTTKSTAIMVSGSGLYINAVINGLDEMPEIDLSVRDALNTKFEKEGIQSIQKQLAKLDPVYFAKVDQNNPQRMIRALEVFLSTGKKLSSMLSSIKKERPFKILKIGLNTEREALYQRINKRVDEMMDDGLLAEVKSLTALKKLNALKTVGYSELFDYLDGKITLPKAVEAIKQNTRRFAKRQLTWFRKDTEINWFKPDELQPIINLIEIKLRQFNSSVF